MTTFDEREKAFEKRFAHDAELKFKAEARRNKALARWAGEKLGIAADGIDAYAKEIQKADLAEKGDEDVFRKLRKDFDAKGVKIADADIRRAMIDFLAKAVSDVEGERKK